MAYNLDDPQDKQALETKIIEWIADARAVHQTMYTEWNDADAYYESDQVPPGFTERHADSLADKNDPTKPSTEDKQYVVVNKVYEAHENILGDFIGARKSIQIRGRSPKDRKIGNAIRAEIQHIEDETELWDRVMVPVIDNTILRGLDWIKIRFNPFQNLPYGKTEISRVSCRDVMIDPDTYDQYMEDTGYRILMQRMPVKKAQKKYGEYLGGLIFAPDSDADNAHSNRKNKGTHERFCTIYEIYYVELDCKYFLNNPNSDAEDEEIDADRFGVMSANPRTADSVYKVENETNYVAHFNTGTGVFSNEEESPNTWLLIPSINIKRESRAYPFGDAIYYRNLQDLMNVLMSVALENAKKGNHPIVGVDIASYSKYSQQINEALNSPGTKALPATNLSVHYPKEINQAVVNLLGMAEKFIYDLSSKHAASRGELPTQQIAQNTVNTLIAQDRQSHGRKDVTIRWTMTQIAKVLYLIAAENYTEEHWAQLTDSKVGEPDYVPINFRLTEDEYKKFLLEMMGIDMEALQQSGDQNAFTEAQAAVAKFKVKFEAENEVKPVKITTYLLQDGRRLTKEQMDSELRNLDITYPEYKAKYHSSEEQSQLILVNDLSSDPNVDVRYDIDFNFEQDRIARQNRAVMLRQLQAITNRRLLRELDFPDADEAAAEAEQENQMLMLGKQIIESGALDQVMMLLSQLKKAA